MCGIAGILAHDLPAQGTEVQVAEMVERLRHRGPDDFGVEAGDGWCIGMRRLAVQDLSREGHQPMSRGDWTVVFNGEVYNFPELREELRREGVKFSSGSDTEVVVRALEAWGTGALPRFNGMFALVAVDRRRRVAILARDRFGKKPLFVATLGRGVAFASELKAILRIARDELTIDRDALAGYFRHLYVPGPASIFTQVRKLPAASWQEIDLVSGRATQPKGFYELPGPTAAGGATTPEQVLDVVREATRRRLIADVPVGAFLSGGVDSSLVVACMTELAADVRTFSIGFADPRYDESVYARAVADHLGTRHTHHQLEAREALDAVDGWAEAYDEPFADSSAIPTMAVARLARRDVTVALSGDGGDELFGGYHRYAVRGVLKAASRVPALAGRALASVPQVADRRPRLAAHLAAGTDGLAYQESQATWRAEDLRALMPAAEPAAVLRDHVDRAPGRAVERMMRADLRTYLIDDILQKVDRATMAVSLEARNPLLDPDVVALALADVRRAEGAPGRKSLLRDTLALRLPRNLIDRPKKGFAVPVSDWMRDELRPLVEDLVLARDAEEYDSSTAHRVARAHLAGETTAGSRLWSLVAYELWRSRWLG